jgi:hypothetical protein
MARFVAGSTDHDIKCQRVRIAGLPYLDHRWSGAHMSFKQTAASRLDNRTQSHPVKVRGLQGRVGAERALREVSQFDAVVDFPRVFFRGSSIGVKPTS